MFVLLLAALLGACGKDGSEPAQRAPNDLGLAQCQLVDGTMLGAPADPIMIDGVATQACRITDGHIAGGARVDLKTSHQYQPLVWLLDGTLEIGDSRSYATLDEFVDGELAHLSVASGVLRATAGALIVVHRNGFFEGNVVSVDEDLAGSGEWAGIVVNSIGSHVECPADTSTSKFCNVQGAHGYYGGLSAADARTQVIGDTILSNAGETRPRRLGFAGSVSEAGGALAGGEPLPAAVVLNAPLTYRSNQRISVFDAAGSGVELNGGYFGKYREQVYLQLVVQNAAGNAAYWHNGFEGAFTGVFYHGQSDEAALRGESGQVALEGVTLIDRDFTAGTAIGVQGGQVALNNVLVQNFRSCLQLDAGAGATLNAVAFGCLEATAPAEDGIDHAAVVTAAALEQGGQNYFQASPDLTPDLRVGNSSLRSAYAHWGASSEAHGGRIVVASAIDAYALHNLRLIYQDCLGIGTLLPEDRSVTVGRTTYRLCELSGTIDRHARLSGGFNDESFAWVLSGAVNVGANFGELSETRQLAALAAPLSFAIPSGTPVYARAGASLTVQPGVNFIVGGTVASPVAIAPLPGDESGHWGGVRVNGVDGAACQHGSAAGICAYADDRRLSIEYLRVRSAGLGQPALQLSEVGVGAAIGHLQIVDSAGVGLALHGGRANIGHLLLTDNAGDQLIWERGYRGTIQHGLFTSAATSAGHVLLGRNDGANHDAEPRSRPTLANLTMVGAGQAAAAIRLEQGSGVLLYNSVVSGFATCLDIDDAATAALQSSTPQQIAMIDVVLNCTSTLSADDEDGGFDYGYAVAHSATVQQVDPQLDENYLPTNPSLPGTPATIDLSLAGDAATHLDSNAGHRGAVANADDGWYRDWSGLGIRLSPECDGKGFLDDDFQYTFSELWAPLQDQGYSGNITVNYKICRLPATISANLELTRYTGVDAPAAANGTNVVVTENGSKYGLSGTVSWQHLPAPTIWLLDGMVTVADGARELSDAAEVAALKANPVALTLQPGTWVMAADANSGLHVTRGARLQILGEPMLMDDVCSYDGLAFGECFALATTGPVSFFGPREPDAFGATLPTVVDMGFGSYSGDYAPYAPLGDGYPPYGVFYAYSYSLPWRGLVIDGFARNNQCPDAAVAEPDSQACNIAAEFGHHGGYDDEYTNVDIDNLYMAGGLLHFNSVAGSIEGLHYSPPASFAADQTGAVAILTLDGGRLNVRELVVQLTDPFGEDNYGSARPGSLIRWHHGYRGSLQHIYGRLAQSADGQESRLSANGRDYFVPLLRGANGDPGHEDDLPRSMPTIANLSLLTYERDTTGAMASDVDSSLIEVGQGSGLFLHHSVMGTDGEYGGFGGLTTDFCFKLDASVADRVAAGEFVVNQLATTCATLTDNAEVTLAGMAGVDNGYWAASQAVFLYRFDFPASEQDYVDFFGPDPVAVRLDENRRYPVPQLVNDYGHVMLDASSSPSADNEFLHVTDYLGAVDYWARP